MKVGSDLSLDIALKHTEFPNQNNTMSHHNQCNSYHNQGNSPQKSCFQVFTPPSFHLRVESPCEYLSRLTTEGWSPFRSVLLRSMHVSDYTPSSSQKLPQAFMDSPVQPVHQPAVISYAPISPNQGPSPAISGLRPNTTLRGPNAAFIDDPDTEKDFSIKSNESLTLIPPCKDFARHVYWLKKYLLFLMTKSTMNFDKNVLGIKSYNTALNIKLWNLKIGKCFLAASSSRDI